MMGCRSGLMFFISLLIVLPSAAQKQEDNSQTLQQILVELKLIDQNLRTTQSTQILIAEFEMQQGVVDHATEAADRVSEKFLRDRTRPKIRGK